MVAERPEPAKLVTPHSLRGKLPVVTGDFHPALLSGNVELVPQVVDSVASPTSSIRPATATTSTACYWPARSSPRKLEPSSTARPHAMASICEPAEAGCPILDSLSIADTVSSPGQAVWRMALSRSRRVPHAATRSCRRLRLQRSAALPSTFRREVQSFGPVAASFLSCPSAARARWP